MDERGRRIRAGMAAVAALVAAVSVAGSLLRIGPFAAPLATTVTDPGEILASSLQALLDAETVHLSVELSGSLPGELAGGSGPVTLDGVRVEADVDLAAVRTRTTVDHDGVDGPDLEVRTIWDDAWHRVGEGPWVRTAVSEVLDLGAVDLNPITLVERVRDYLEAYPATRLARGIDLPCVGGMCRVVVLEAGITPLGLLVEVLPAEQAAHLPEGDVTLTLQAQVDTLRPVVAFLELAAPDGRPILAAAIRFRAWNETVAVLEPSPSPADQGG